MLSENVIGLHYVSLINIFAAAISLNINLRSRRQRAVVVRGASQV